MFVQPTAVGELALEVAKGRHEEVRLAKQPTSPTIERGTGLEIAHRQPLETVDRLLIAYQLVIEGHHGRNQTGSEVERRGGTTTGRRSRRRQHVHVALEV